MTSGLQPATDHPVLIPTAEGAVGGIVSAPAGAPRAALVLLQGAGRPARSGVNSFWTRRARAFAERGIAVLRADYSREGETLPVGEGGSGRAWKRAFDLALLREVTPWFAERTGPVPLYLAGLCFGGRLAIELAGRDPEAFAGLFLIAPYLRVLERAGEEPPASNAVDPEAAEHLRTALGAAPVRVLVGERDTEDLPGLERLLGPAVRELTVEEIPDLALHFLDQPDTQAEAARWLDACLADAS